MLSCKCWLSGLAYSIPLSNKMFSGRSRSAPKAASCVIVEHRNAAKNVFKAGMKRVLKERLAPSSNQIVTDRLHRCTAIFEGILPIGARWFEEVILNGQCLNPG